VVARIQKLADRMRTELGDVKQPGAGLREPGRIVEGDLWFDWKPGVPLDVEPKPFVPAAKRAK